MLRHLFERAIRSTPELIVIDYMSETLVDAARLSAASRKLNYNVSCKLDYTFDYVAHFLFAVGNFSEKEVLRGLRRSHNKLR